MGKKLVKKNTRIEQFVSSPALRAKTTAELFVAEYDRKLKEILYVPSLYHADPDTFYEIVSHLDDAYDHVALFSHNPGITDFAGSLTTAHISNMPTSSVFAVTAPVNSWKDFSSVERSFLFFYKPEEKQKA
jgi:phosphohistidine phosphatase